MTLPKICSCNSCEPTVHIESLSIRTAKKKAIHKKSEAEPIHRNIYNTVPQIQQLAESKSFVDSAVTPLAGVWIEIQMPCKPSTDATSLPSRECGLK